MFLRRFLPLFLGLVLVGCRDDVSSPSPAADVEATPEEPASAPEIDVSPLSLDFGEVLVESRGTLSVTVQNTGSAALAINSVALSDGTSGDFEIVAGSESISIASGANITVEILYTPAEVGADTGTLLIESDDADEPLIVVPLSGSGVPEPIAEIEVVPTTLDFGEVLIGSSSSLNVTVSNTGSATLDVTNIEIGAGTSSDFSMTPASPGGSVMPGADMMFQVEYAPSGEGPAGGTVAIESSDADEPVISLLVSGTGILSPEPEIEVTPLSLNFGEVPIGSSASLSVEVTNTGTADLSVSDYALDGDASLEFQVISGPGAGATLSPGANANIEVAYTPEDLVSDSATLRIQSDDADESLVVVSLSGSGAPEPEPEVVVTPLALDFGEVFIGGSQSLGITVRNSGTAPLEVTSVTFGVGTSADFTMGSPTGSVAPGAEITFQVAYTPVDEGADSGAVIIESDDANEPLITVSLTGNGILESTTSSITLQWEAPTLNTDGTPLEDLAGFEIHRGSSSGNYTEVTDVGDVTQFTLELPAGRYYLSVTAYDLSGNVSDFSNEVTVTLE